VWVQECPGSREWVYKIEKFEEEKTEKFSEKKETLWGLPDHRGRGIRRIASSLYCKCSALLLLFY
jgi:hypothetical protein